MKNTIILLTVILFSTVAWSQKKEKIKASKIVTVSQKEIGNFDSLEILDNIDVFLVKGNSCAIEIEADDNLHEIINYEVSGNVLKINALKLVKCHIQQKPLL